MSPVVLWIDHKQVKIFEIAADAVKKTRLLEKHVDHHTHTFDNLDKDEQARAFFDRIAGQLAVESKILILGPGVQKLHFRKYLQDKHHALATNIVGCEISDHPTEPQIIAIARKYFT